LFNSAAVAVNPKFVSAPAAVEAPVPPSAIAKSTMLVINPPPIDTRLADCVAIVPSSRFVRALSAVEAPVPPAVMAKAVIPVIDPPVIDTELAD
jgi:hypothetical protein